jgi:hypothetical protein
MSPKKKPALKIFLGLFSLKKEGVFFQKKK